MVKSRNVDTWRKYKLLQIRLEIIVKKSYPLKIVART